MRRGPLLSAYRVAIACAHPSWIAHLRALGHTIEEVRHPEGTPRGTASVHSVKSEDGAAPQPAPPSSQPPPAVPLGEARTPEGSGGVKRARTGGVIAASSSGREGGAVSRAGGGGGGGGGIRRVPFLVCRCYSGPHGLAAPAGEASQRWARGRGGGGRSLISPTLWWLPTQHSQEWRA